MTIQGIGSSYTYASSFISSYTSSTSSGTEETSGFEIPPPPPPMDATEIMDQDDANSDGVLTLEETALSAEMFASADADGDGELSSDELEDMLASTPPPPMGGAGGSDDALDAESIMAKDDANGDGVLTVDETPLTEEMFATADEDGDGELSSEELAAYVTAAPGGGAGVPGAEDSEANEEFSASTTAAMIMDAYETASFGSLFSQSEDDNSYASLLSGLVV